MLQLNEQRAVSPASFSGRDRVHVTRVALDFWFQHRVALGLSALGFLERCRLSSDQRTITFSGTLSGTLSGAVTG